MTSHRGIKYAVTTRDTLIGMALSFPLAVFLVLLLEQAFFIVRHMLGAF